DFGRLRHGTDRRHHILLICHHCRHPALESARSSGIAGLVSECAFSVIGRGLVSAFGAAIDRQSAFAVEAAVPAANLKYFAGDPPSPGTPGTALRVIRPRC